MAHETKSVWSKGQISKSESGCMYVAGIDVDDHGNAVECYGETMKEAKKRRRVVMDALKLAGIC